MAIFLRNFSKFTVILMGGLLATLSLFFSMQYLITSDFEQPVAGPQFKIADITAPELEIEVMRKQPLPEKPEELEAPPAIDIARNADFDIGQPGFDIPQPEVPELDTPDNFGISNANAVPLAMAPAQYPARALQRGIEGYVVVEFDVDETGRVIDPRVIYEEPEGYFATAAFKALESYRYQPKIVDGRPAVMYGVQQKITFTLEE